jgi:hypothetical protein
MNKILHFFRLPYIWGTFAILIGLILGVSSLAVWLIAGALITFLIFMRVQGEAREETEGALFMGGPAIMIFWIVGFVLSSIIKDLI